METDYEGTSFATIYQASQGDIAYLYTIGKLIYLIEDGQYIVALDTETGNSETIMARAGVSSLFLFDADKLIWYDDKQTPHYYNITEQLTLTLSDEAAVFELISFYMADEVQPEQSTYSVNGITDNQELYNNITIPLPEYPANLQYNFNTLTNVQSFYTGVGQCDGFAKYAHNRFWHLDSYGSGPSWNASSGDYHGASPSEILDDEYNPYTDTDIANIEKREDYYSFFANLDRGTFLRFVSKNDTTPYDGNHSIFFNGMTESGDGYYAYECNQKEENNRPNAVGYQIYQFDMMAGHYKLVLYYVEHTLGAKTYYTTGYHKAPCTNCAGYLLQPHIGNSTNKIANTTNHYIGYSCCSGGLLRAHDGTVSYQKHNLSKHQVSYSCCSGYVLQGHTFVNSRCTACGQSEISGGIVASTPGVAESMNG